MRLKFLLLLSSVLFFTCNEKKSNYQFLPLDFDDARVYLYDGINEQLIVENGKLDSTITNQEGDKLSKEELLQLDGLLSNQDTTNNYLCNEQAGCFNPHHGVVFYKQQNIIGQLTLCFGCNVMKTNLGEPAGCLRKLQNLFDSFKLKVNNQFYPANAQELSAAIQLLNSKRYGENYRERMLNP